MSGLGADVDVESRRRKDVDREEATLEGGGMADFFVRALVELECCDEWANREGAPMRDLSKAIVSCDARQVRHGRVARQRK